MEKFKLTRQDLFDRVWSKSTVKVAKEIGCSDVAVSKMCAKMGVPKPPPGYWAKVDAGGKHNKPTLPPLKEGQCEWVLIDVLPPTLPKDSSAPAIPVPSSIESETVAVRYAKYRLQQPER